MSEQYTPEVFEEAMLPHLNRAYNLARWMVRNEQDAEDVVQEAYLCAFRSFAGFRGGNSRAWLLKIVRNTCYTLLKENRPQQLATMVDEEIHTEASDTVTPEALLLQSAGTELLMQALEELPLNFREVLVLRELQGLSYKEIATVSGVPVGTVMSSLSRARGRLRQALIKFMTEDRSVRSEPCLRA